MSQQPHAGGAREPQLSVILPTCDNYSTIRLTVRALSRQTIRDRIELVIVAPVDDPGVNEDEVAAFGKVTIVNGGPLRTSNISRSAGIRAASAPIVVLSEDHSFPEPDWAEALLKAHESGCAVAGPVIRNSNPKSLTSWANLLLEYGPWLDGAPRGEASDLPGHNSAYNRDVLLAYGDRLESVLEVEAVVQKDLIENGHHMLLEPRAVTSHLNFSRLRSSLGLRFNAGRSFAGYRTTGWPARKRLLYIAGGALIPFVRFARIAGMLRRSPNYSWLFPRVLPSLCVMLVVDGVGEIAGYITGPGDSPRFLGEIEFNRVRFMNAADRAEYSEMVAALT
ncbi:MAG: glycosyltransferase [Thermoanaerobaculia bacterium]